MKNYLIKKNNYLQNITAKELDILKIIIIKYGKISSMPNLQEIYVIRSKSRGLQHNINFWRNF